MILLVEDNADDAALAVRALRQNGFAHEVVRAKDGVEALDFLHGFGEHASRDTRDLPMLVLLDLKLPRKDGLTVLQEIRQSPLTRRLPVVILTSSRDDADLASGYDRGANSCVRKPVDFTEFVKTLNTLATYWLKINEQPPRS
ncbi:MAG: response regulator [Candidatus Nanopelagicales bacterium]|jgi:two-component system response regulator